MNKTILFVSLNARYSHSNPAVFYLHQALANCNIESEISEYSINTPADELLNNLYDRKADVYSFSVYIWNVSLVKQVAINLKRIMPESVIVFGGPEVSYNPQEYTDIADYIISGPGEKAIINLAESDFSVKGKIIYGQADNFELSDNPYKNIDLKCLENKIIYYEASRGCIFKCSYCLSSREDMKLSRKSIKKVSAELDYILGFKPDLIKFIDRSFNCDRNYSLQLWKSILSKTTNTGFHFEIHPAFVIDEDIEFLSTVPENKFQFEIGIQSTDDAVNYAVSRFQKWNDIRSNLLKLIQLKNIHTHIDMITGLPHQDYKSASVTLNDLFNTGADHIQIGFLKVLQGTTINTCYNNLIHTVEPPYEVLSTDWMSYSEIRKFKKIAVWMEILHNSGKFSNTLNWLIRKYDSPMLFFETLLDFELSCRLTNNRWLTVAEFLLDLCDEYLPEQRHTCMDYLRWDWCLITKNLHYPDLLGQEKSKTIRKLLYEKLNFCNNNINLIPILKKSIIFLPDSDEFELSGSEEITMFFHEDGNRKTMQISMKGVIE